MPTVYGKTCLSASIHVHVYPLLYVHGITRLLSTIGLSFTCTEMDWDGGGSPNETSVYPLTWRIYKDMEFDSTQLIYLTTEDLGDSSTAVNFVWDNFVYTAFCFEGIIQFIKAQRQDVPLYDGTTATLEQAMLKDSRREFFNGDHAPLQSWIDSL